MWRSIEVLVLLAAAGSARLDHETLPRREPPPKTTCVQSSLCEHCTPDELTHETYCFKTGRRVELTCPRFGDPANGVAVRYEACDRTARDDAAAVYRFETWMVVVGVAALAVVRKRKLRSQSLYDKRARDRDDGCL